ncbi:MAG: Crp/Fnr family transcriptional regulator [Leptospiraceae bacterium]|nr:Crp/Fnr family transcriptional regulator [Leptospiraceae bacterium]MCZ8345699.1 Crp/Fnr family transcriptional regulator [Leptospiraceae bacterium]
MNGTDLDSENPNCETCNIRTKSILQNATPETIEKINNGKHFNKHSRGNHIFKSGDLASGFYFIKSGFVRNYRSTGGKEQTFNIRGPGDWIGFRDAISSDSFFHSCICLEDVETCFITKELTEILMKEDEKFQSEVLRQMAKEWRESESQVVSLGTKQVHSKLAELLITLKDAAGGSDEIEIKMTREVLASIIGTTTETLVRALTDFKNRNIVHVEKHKVTFQDMAALYSLSEMELDKMVKVHS